MLNVTLASSLLDLELENSQDEAATKVDGGNFKTGISCLDKGLPDDLWSGGTVIGIGIDSGNTVSDVKPLPLEIIATHLTSEAKRISYCVGSEQEAKTSVFIVAPPDQGTASIRRVYQILSSRLLQTQSNMTGSRDATAASSIQVPQIDAKQMLNGVSLLQYLDISGLSESLSEVFTVLSSQRSESEGRRRTIVLIQGMSSCIGVTQRLSGIVQTAALSSSILSSVRNIVRGSSGLCLGLVEVDILWLKSIATATPGNTAAVPSPAARSDVAMKGLNTAFAPKMGKLLRMNMNNSLSRIIEEDVDVLVAMHDADGKIDVRQDTRRIVEVVRDERADHAGEENAMGTWAVWS